MKSSRKALLLSLALISNLFTAVGISQALTVSPVKIELAGDPGETLTADFRLLNEQDSTLTFYASTENFEAEGESGTPNFVPGNTGLASWITLNQPTEETEGETPEETDPNKVTLAPQEEVSRTLTVAIPEDATPGGHFAALFWATTPPSEEESVAVGAKVGILVFLSVSGDFEQGGDLLSFNTKDEQESFTNLPVTFEYRFQNVGADRVVPQGTIELKNVLGWTSDVIQVNSSQNNVLPTSVRKFQEVWGEPLQTEEESTFWTSVEKEWSNFALGPYTATLNLSYGPDNTTTSSSLEFWVFPWQLLLVGSCAVLAVLFFGAITIRRYNRWIVNAALQAQQRPKKKK